MIEIASDSPEDSRPRGTSEVRSELVVWLALYVAVVTFGLTVAHATGDLHNDVLEAYAWGRELQLGYHKHPPFWAWLTYAWFGIFPMTNGFGYLLGALNGAIGLGCTWMIARKFLPADKATVAVLGLMTTTMYLCFAGRFNANTILLSLWPATTLAVLRAAETDRLISGAVAGVLVGLCLLSKYQSITFLAALFVAVYFLKRSATVYRSRAAIACYLVAGATVAPHVAWLVHHGLLPFRYADVTTARAFGDVVREVALFPLASVLFLAPAFVVYSVAAGWNWRQALAAFAKPFVGERAFVAILALGPLVVTMVACLVRSSTLKPLYATPMFFMVPIWFAMSPVGVGPGLLGRARKACAAVLIGTLVIAPVIAGVAVSRHAAFAIRPKAEIVRAVTAEWHRRFDRPLRIVAGTEDYAIAAPFYGGDGSSYLVGLDRRVLHDFDMSSGNEPTAAILGHSPWITPQRIAEEGLAVICSQEPKHLRLTGCDEEAANWIGPGGQFELMTAAKSLLGWELPEHRFKVYFRPPGAAESASTGR